MNERTTDDTTTTASATSTIHNEPTLSPEVFFNEDFWTSNARKFILFTERRLQRRRWRGAFNGRPPGGKEAADYVSAASLLLMSAQRRYTARYSPERCVYATIASLISHDGDAAENQIAHSFLTTSYSVDAEGDEVDEGVVASDIPDIEETIAAHEYLERYKTNFSKEEHRRYLDLLSDGYVSAELAAAELDLLESEIQNIRKVVRRPRKKWPGRPPRY